MDARKCIAMWVSDEQLVVTINNMHNTGKVGEAVAVVAPKVVFWAAQFSRLFLPHVCCVRKKLLFAGWYCLGQLCSKYHTRAMHKTSDSPQWDRKMLDYDRQRLLLLCFLLFTGRLVPTVFRWSERSIADCFAIDDENHFWRTHNRVVKESMKFAWENP